MVSFVNGSGEQCYNVSESRADLQSPESDIDADIIHFTIAIPAWNPAR